MYNRKQAAAKHEPTQRDPEPIDVIQKMLRDVRTFCDPGQAPSSAHSGAEMFRGMVPFFGPGRTAPVKSLRFRV